MQPPRLTNHKEVTAIVFTAVLVHAGMAVSAVYLDERAPHEGARRMRKVEVEVARPPVFPPRPVLPPPPEPTKPKPVLKPMAQAKQELEKLPPVVQPQPPPPVDAGSTLPSDVDGELHAGTGGLGTTTPAPLAPPAPAAAPVLPAPVIQAHEGANYLKNPRPRYPSRARLERWEGTTVLRVQVSPSGKPSLVKIQKSSGHELLDQAALEAVQAWTFTPANQGGKPIAGWVNVPMVFRLSSAR